MVISSTDGSVDHLHQMVGPHGVSLTLHQMHGGSKVTRDRSLLCCLVFPGFAGDVHGQVWVNPQRNGEEVSPFPRFQTRQIHHKSQNPGCLYIGGRSWVPLLHPLDWTQNRM